MFNPNFINTTNNNISITNNYLGNKGDYTVYTQSGYYKEKESISANSISIVATNDISIENCTLCAASLIHFNSESTLVLKNCTIKCDTKTVLIKCDKLMVINSRIVCGGDIIIQTNEMNGVKTINAKNIKISCKKFDDRNLIMESTGEIDVSANEMSHVKNIHLEQMKPIIISRAFRKETFPHITFSGSSNLKAVGNVTIKQNPQIIGMSKIVT